MSRKIAKTKRKFVSYIEAKKFVQMKNIKSQSDWFDYKKKNKLSADYIGRGGAWLDTGSIEDYFKTLLFVHAIENRQGVKIACLEEIALNNKLAVKIVCKVNPETKANDRKINPIPRSLNTIL